MRLLLILSLMLASLAMTAPAAAQNGEAAMSCHTMSSSNEGHAPHPDGADDRAPSHMCPGCACIGPDVASAKVPNVVADYRSVSVRGLASHAASPIPPPPRAA